MKKLIITLEGQYGLPVLQIAELLSGKLEIPCYDSELDAKVAEKIGYTVDFVAERGSYAPDMGPFSCEMEGRTDGLSPSDKIRHTMKSTIMEYAVSPCIIIGRCANYYLKDQANRCRIYLIADKSKREAALVNSQNFTESDARKMIKDRDARRASNYQYITDHKISDTCLYDYVIQCDTCDAGKIVEQIMEILSK